MTAASVQMQFTPFTYPEPMPGLRAVQAQLLQRLAIIRDGQPGDIFEIDAPGIWELWKPNHQIRYVTPDGEKIEKTGTLVLPVKHWCVVYWYDEIEGEAHDIWQVWILKPDGVVTCSKKSSVPSSEPGMSILKRREGGSFEYLRMDIYQNGDAQKCIRYNSKTHNEEVIPGWQWVPEWSRVVMIRNPGDRKHWWVLEEQDIKAGNVKVGGER